VALLLLSTADGGSVVTTSLQNIAITAAPVPSPGGSTKTDVKDLSSGRITSYQLPPDLYRKARNRGRTNFASQLLDWVYGFLILWVLLRARVAVRFRDWAERVSHFRGGAGPYFCSSLSYWRVSASIDGF
jgi:hypothetical protein